MHPGEKQQFFGQPLSMAYRQGKEEFRAFALTTFQTDLGTISFHGQSLRQRETRETNLKVRNIFYL
jgi:hypothetical protein